MSEIVNYAPILQLLEVIRDLDVDAAGPLHERYGIARDGWSRLERAVREWREERYPMPEWGSTASPASIHVEALTRLMHRFEAASEDDLEPLGVGGLAVVMGIIAEAIEMEVEL